MASLKELMKLAGLNGQKLADQLQLEYSHVSTCLAMDERNEEPKRPSVRARMAEIREHLEKLNIASSRIGDGDTKRRPTSVFDSPEEASRRYPVAPGCAQAHSYDKLVLGSRVKLRLDPDSDVVIRFLRVVTKPDGSQHADGFDVETGSLRSVRLEELATGVRTR